MIKSRATAQGRGVEADDWTRVEEAALRKKIQNRLAQRNHRQKYGRKKKTTSQSSSGSSANASSPDTTPSIECGVSHPASAPMSQQFAMDEINLSFLDEIVNMSPGPSSGESTRDRVTQSIELYNSGRFRLPSPTADTKFLVLQTTNTITAMLFNASLLGIACSDVRGQSIFIPTSMSTPASLAPTPLQATRPHWPYVDILPIPALRDKLLQAHDVIDPRDIWQDLIDGEVKVWGTQSWNERGWEISERFATKWWFLMDDDVLSTTNFWRAARGQQDLNVRNLKRMIGQRIEEA